ncbi:ribosomal protein S18 [Hypoxylon sp. FL1284]|nr:ribosomal protein S18 [Hypoxylon sp. FL1284]
MPPRIPILAALRKPSTLLTAQKAGIATSNPSQAIRKDLPTAASSLLDVDDSSPSPLAVPQGAPRPASVRAESLRADSTRGASDIYETLRTARVRREATIEDVNKTLRNEDYARQLTRRYVAGDVYAPHDLSPIEMAKWRRNQARKLDLVDMLGLHPLDMYRNFSVISEYMTSHGRIKKSVETGLRPPNQRKMAKAVRRAIGLGLHPSVHHHPELLTRETRRVGVQNMASIKQDVQT